MKNKIKKTLELSAQMKASLEQRLKKLRPIKHVQVKEEGDTIEEINQKSNIGEYLFQSDIVLTQQQFEEIEEDVKEELSEGNRTKRQAFRDGRYPKTIWSDGVNYYFDYSATQDKIRVFAENGCWSYVGRLGGKQDLSLGRGCESVGTAAHELGHALGFYHTMSRHDRDNFITLNTHNVKPDWLDQFTKQTPQTNENYGITYDYGSIMHYGGTR
ncbi:astacin [Ancylostoma duodenale]|uniref:Metalloendopeptidase n=1 Tax=Ancylostoma duodenale TaxID=51022 RepID=A0A0C2C8B9_9BILA|nr:astacin [Ancylostoma duodenale]